MKKAFFEYYAPTPEEISSIWRNCLLVLDANVLLNLYRYSVSTRDDILSTLKKFSSKLWMPFQIGWEYQNNRELVISKTYGLPKELSCKIRSKKEDFLNSFKSEYLRNPYLSQEALSKKLDKLEASLVKFIEDRFKDAPDMEDEDIVCRELNAIYDGKVGEDFSHEELLSLYQDGMQRYSAKIPPGYKDASEKKDRRERHIYGDLILWKQIIRYSGAQKKDVIFVCEDLKEDWMRIENGKTKGPRRELLREFHDETGGQKIVFMNQQRFLDFVHSLPEHSVKSSTIKEVNVNQEVLNVDHSLMSNYLNALERIGAFSKDATKAASLFTSGVYPISESFRKMTEMTSSPFWDKMKAASCHAFMDDNEQNDAEVEVSNQSNGAAEDDHKEVNEKEAGND